MAARRDALSSTTTGHTNTDFIMPDGLMAPPPTYGNHTRFPAPPGGLTDSGGHPVDTLAPPPYEAKSEEPPPYSEIDSLPSIHTSQRPPETNHIPPASNQATQNNNPRY